MKRFRFLVAGVCLTTSVGAVLGAPHLASAASCSVPESPQQPTVASESDVTVGGGSVPVFLAGKKGKWDLGPSIPAGKDYNKDVPIGGLFFLLALSAYDENDGSVHHCRYDASILLERKYPDASWAGFFGINSFLLNQTDYAKAIKSDYEPVTTVDETTQISVTLTLPESGPFSAETYFGTDSYGYLDTATTSNKPISTDADKHTVTLHGLPAVTGFDTEVWPASLPPSYEPDNGTVAAYSPTQLYDPGISQAQKYLHEVGGLDLSNGDTSGLPARQSCHVKKGTAYGGSDLHKFESGLHYRAILHFSEIWTGSKSAMVHEWLRGGWNENVNSGCSSLQFFYDAASGSKGLQLQADNYHQFIDGTPVTGHLRVMYPDAWTQQAFGVTSGSPLDQLQNAITATRQDRVEGNSTVQVAVTSVPDGADPGLIVDAGQLTFSKPRYRVFRRQLSAVRTTPSAADGVVYVNIGPKAQKKCKYTKATTTYTCKISLTFVNDLDQYTSRGKIKYRNRTIKVTVSFLAGHGFTSIPVSATLDKATTSLRALDATKYTVKVGSLKIGTVTVPTPLPT